MGRAGRADHPVGRRALGLARADRVHRRGAAEPLRPRLDRVPAPGRGGLGQHRAAGHPLLLALPRRGGRFELRVASTWISMVGLLSLTLISTDVFDLAGLPALPAIALGFLAPERRPALEGLARARPRDSRAETVRPLERSRAGSQRPARSTRSSRLTRLDVRRVREHVDRAAANELVAEVLAQRLQVGGERRRVARDVDDARRPEAPEPPERLPGEAGTRRIDDDDVRLTGALAAAPRARARRCRRRTLRS